MTMKKQRKGFFICPVRGHDPKETEAIVKKLEDEGWDIHWPPRDTKQEDPETGGFRICVDNENALEQADRVFLVWDGKSKGCLFDLGAAFALNKPLTVIEAPPNVKEGKSFQNMARYWADMSVLEEGEMDGYCFSLKRYKSQRRKEKENEFSIEGDGIEWETKK